MLTCALCSPTTPATHPAPSHPDKPPTDLRRLKDHDFNQRIPHSHRYRVTSTGRARAIFLARTHDRRLTTGLAELTTPATSTRIQQATRAYQQAADDLTERAGLHIAA